MSYRIVQNLLDFLWSDYNATIQHLTFDSEEYGIDTSETTMSVACELMTTDGFKLKIHHFNLYKYKGVWNFYGDTSSISIEIVHGHTRNSVIHVVYQIKDAKPLLHISKGYDVVLSLHSWIESNRKELTKQEN